MADELATLGIAVDSSPVEKATKSLDDLVQSAEKAEAATASLGESAGEASARYKEIAQSAVARQAALDAEVRASISSARATHTVTAEMAAQAQEYTRIASAELAAQHASERQAASQAAAARAAEANRVSLQRLLGQIDPLETKLNRLDEMEQKLTQTYRQGAVDVETYAVALAKINGQRNGIADQQLRQVATGINGVGISAKQTANAMRLIPMQMTDIVTQLAGGQNPFLILTQQGGQLKDVFGGVGPALRGVGTYVMGLVNPFTIAAAAAGVLAVAYEMGSRESQKFNQSLTLTGGFAGKTSDQLADMAVRIGNVSGTTGKAADALNQIAASGRLTGGVIESIGLAAVAMNEATGKAVKDTVAEFEKLAESPSRAIAELNSRYHFLTASVYEQIKALEDQGNKQGAANLAEQTYAAALKTRAQSVVDDAGLMERAWKSLAGVAKGAWDAMLDVGRPDTLQQKIDAANQQIANSINTITTAGAGMSGGGYNYGPAAVASAQALLDKQIAVRDALVSQQSAANAATTALNTTQDAEQAGRVAVDALTKTYETGATRTEKMNKALKGLHDNLDAVRKVNPNSTLLDPAKIAEAEAAIRKQYKEPATNSAGGASVTARLRARLVEEQALSAELANQGTHTAKLNEYERAALVIGEQLKGSVSAKTRATLEGNKALNEQVGALVRNNAATQTFNAEREKSYQAQANTIAKIQEQTQSLQDQIDTYGMGKSAVEEMTIARLEETKAALLLYGDGAKTVVEGINAEIAARKNLAAAMFGKEALDAQKKFADKMERQNEQIGNSLTDALLRGFESGKDFAQNFIDTLKNMFASLVLKPIVLPIVTTVAGAVTGALGFGSAAAAQGVTGTASSASSLLSIGSNLKGLYSAFTGGFSEMGLGIAKLGAKLGSDFLVDFGGGFAGAQSSTGIAATLGAATSFLAATGAGYGLGTLISGNKAAFGSAMVSNIGGSAIGAAIGSIVPGIGTLIGGLAGGAIGGLINQAFGKGPKEYGNTSIIGSLGGATGFNGTLQTPWEQSGGWFSSGDSGTRFDVMSNEQSQAIGSAFNLIRTGVAALASSVGTSANALINYSEQIKITLTDDAAANQKLIDDTLSGVGERMITALIPTIAQYSKQSETVTQTLQRLGSSLAGVNTNLSLVHKGLLDISLTGADAASKLADAFGGLDNLTQSTQAFYQAAFTDAERAANSMTSMQQALQAVGQSMPETMVELRNVALGLDLTTDAGRAAYAVLVSIAPTFAQATTALAQQAKDLGAKILAAYTGRDSVVAALDVITLKSAILKSTLVSTYSAAGNISTLFLDVNSGLVTFGSNADDLGGALTDAQKAGLGLSDQMTALRINAGDAAVDFTGLNAALANVSTDAFVAAIAGAFELLAQRITGVIGDINTERQAVRDAALSIIAPDVMTPTAISRQIASINTTLPGNQAVVAAADQLTAADALAAQRKAAEQAAGNAYNPALAAFNTAAAQVGGLQAQYDNLYNVIQGKEAEIAIPRKYHEGRMYVRDLQATMPALYEQLSQLGTALNAVKDASSGAQWNQVVALQERYNAAVSASADAQAAANTAAANAKAANASYADALQAFAIDAGKSVDKLTSLREETVKYYEAQKQLADLMTSSAADLRKTTADFRLSQLSPEQQFASMQTDFAKAYSMALSTDGQTLAGYGAQLNTLLGPLLSKAGDVLSGSQLDSFIATSLARADNIASRLETLAPSTYEADSLDLLGQIDATLAALDESSQSASSIIAAAINAGRDATVNGLRQITNALTGQSVAAFASGGDFGGGVRIVGEKGPELEATGPSRIFNAAQTRSILSGGNDNAQLLAELQALRAEVANLRIEARATAATNAKMARSLDKFERGGLGVYAQDDAPLPTTTEPA